MIVVIEATRLVVVVQVSGIAGLLVDLRTGLKQLRSTILEPAEQRTDLSASDKEALDCVVTFHRDSRATFVQLEVCLGPSGLLVWNDGLRTRSCAER